MKREKVYLSLILVASFVVRLIPHRNLLLAAYDEYLHRDLTLRIVEGGIGTVSRDLPSLLGLRAYSYPPPLFHIIGGAFLYRIFHSDYFFLVIPAVYGTLAVLGFYFAYKELFEDEKKALLATLLLAFAPDFIYRTSLYIPENMGLLLFSLSMFFGVKFLKKKTISSFILFTATFGLYTITHRGWIFFAFAAAIVLLSYLEPTIKRNVHYVIILVLAGLLAYFGLPPQVKSTFGELFLRLQRSEVSFLGYFKWVGVVQLVFGVLGSSYYFKKGPPLQRGGLVLWAWTFLLAGGVSFRFRDPYATISLAAITSEYLIDVVFPPSIGPPILKRALNDVRGFGSALVKALPEKRAVQVLIIAVLILTPAFQGGAYGAYHYIVIPSITDKEAYEWISQNTPPENATILVWWDMGGYLLIGNTHRKDVVVWKKVYQGGFFGEAPPTVKEAGQAYTDHVIMFSSNQRNFVYYLMKKYNVSYIFVDRRRYSYGLVRYGLMEYAPPYDTHFKLEFCNGGSVIYRFIPEPKLRMEQPLPIEYHGNYSPLVNFFEKFWTGYNYADFDTSYKADFNLNGWMVDLYYNLYNKTGDERFKERAEWLLRWLEYKQMDNGGAFPLGGSASQRLHAVHGLHTGAHQEVPVWWNRKSTQSPEIPGKRRLLHDHAKGQIGKLCCERPAASALQGTRHPECNNGEKRS
ncbi:glycosyltransferase family 39 protein [Thermococcus peptonophilus]|uniref:glycosyltransferase family 39 protein n=1 Tax=Thermococcus peptonophilus TaxID=53952 RepID=UPI000AEBF845